RARSARGAATAGAAAFPRSREAARRGRIALLRCLGSGRRAAPARAHERQDLLGDAQRARPAFPDLEDEGRVADRLAAEGGGVHPALLEEALDRFEEQALAYHAAN